MKYLLLGSVALVLTTIMFVMMSKAVYVELRARANRGKTSCRH